MAVPVPVPAAIAVNTVPGLLFAVPCCATKFVDLGIHKEKLIRKIEVRKPVDGAMTI